MKKIYKARLFLVAYLLLAPQICAAAVLPEVDAWYCDELRITALDTVSGNRGSWQERDYITDAGARIHAIWMEGAGEKGWLPAKDTISADDGLMGRGATYRTIVIAGNKALIEKHPITGFSVAVKIDNKGTLTVESKYALEEDVLPAAETLAEMME